MTVIKKSLHKYYVENASNKYSELLYRSFTKTNKIITISKTVVQLQLLLFSCMPRPVPSEWLSYSLSALQCCGSVGCMLVARS
jgi:hypothetical protein